MFIHAIIKGQVFFTFIQINDDDDDDVDVAHKCRVGLLQFLDPIFDSKNPRSGRLNQLEITNAYALRLISRTEKRVRRRPL